jgi:hypothetical protein
MRSVSAKLGSDLASEIAAEYDISEFQKAVTEYSKNMSSGKVLFKLTR